MLDEGSAAGEGFLAGIAKEWEAEALKAEVWRTRVVLAAIRIILAREGGALRKMVTPFKLGLGGRLGSGKQWMSWIALEDVVGILKIVSGADADSRCGELCAGIRRVKCGVATASYEC